ncbi:hypothetical protein Mycch_5183 [Mycolicibacterium chubuense NBB4]|uniref:Uncharacterized protein n=1 Tax=Mycolicibacterium chubuense (strain NBB4) TaxID=710421 RepID=I4BRG2_MYCCN|nr:hypothetical protein [Mycolicibacterium chubuense]AFM19869.1 hypothetical protein Mycch_5183 [Mycolicibacterium chubuense NBB4]
MATMFPLQTRQPATCPACGYPTLEARICAACSPLAAAVQAAVR